MLEDKLPQVRATGKGESELLETLISLKESTPVSIQQIQQWVDDRQGEAIQLITRINSLEENSNAAICFKTTEREKRLVLRPGIPKLVVSIPTAMESPFKADLQGVSPHNGDQLERDSSLFDREELKDTFYALYLFAEANKKDAMLDILIIEAPIINIEYEAKVTARLDLVMSGSRQFCIPSAPTDVRIKYSLEYNDDGAIVSWNPPKHGEREVTGYSVSVHGSNRFSDAEWKPLKLGPNARYARFEDYKSGMKLYGSVQAETVAGKSPLSPSTNSVKTEGIYIVAWLDLKGALRSNLIH